LILARLLQQFRRELLGFAGFIPISLGTRVGSAEVPLEWFSCDVGLCGSESQRTQRKSKRTHGSIEEECVFLMISREGDGKVVHHAFLLTSSKASNLRCTMPCLSKSESTLRLRTSIRDRSRGTETARTKRHYWFTRHSSDLVLALNGTQRKTPSDGRRHPFWEWFSREFVALS
jgi:hypothetical protein